MDDFEKWLRTVCFQEPTPEAYDLARRAWKKATNECADTLSLNRSEAQLMAGEMTASEWRTVAAVLGGLQARMRSNV